MVRRKIEHMKKVHFISIGGSAMHNLAMALADKGYLITGSDDEIVDPARSHLAARGLLPKKEGWDSENITPALDAVIIGMHARADNPELSKAKQLAIPIYSYPEYIYEQSKDKYRVVIGGSHGKTTTTAMIMHVLKHSSVTFDYLIGASVPGFDLTVKLSSEATVMLIEGDEYLSSPIDLRPKFHLYRAHLAALTGIAWDHINVFPTFENYLSQFEVFLKTMEPDGTIVYYEGDPNLRSIVSRHTFPVNKEPYSMPPHRVENGLTYLLTEGTNGSEISIPLDVFGDHNLLNLSAAYHVSLHLGLTREQFYKAIPSFQGASRRLEKIASNDQLTVFWDFAHSPSKLKATIKAVHDQFPGKQLIACMELHTFSSLSAGFLAEYASSMDVADHAIIFFDQHTFEHKHLATLGAGEIKEAFGREDLDIITDSGLLVSSIEHMDLNNCILLLMSSGNFKGIDIKAFARSLVSR